MTWPPQAVLPPFLPACRDLSRVRLNEGSPAFLWHLTHLTCLRIGSSQVGGQARKWGGQKAPSMSWPSGGQLYASPRLASLRLASPDPLNDPVDLALHCRCLRTSLAALQRWCALQSWMLAAQGLMMTAAATWRT